MRYSIILAVSIFLLFPALAFSATLKVPSQYPKIQDAIDASMNGDTVLVAPGTYVENIDFKGKAITVTSEQGVGVTVIDGNEAGSVVTFHGGEGLDSVLEGFTLINGTGTFVIQWGYYGGGIYCVNSSSPTITDNTITGNTAIGGWYVGTGGGIYCSDSSPIISNNIISCNESEDGGGGISCSNSSPEITSNTITENSDDNAFGGGAGGGILCVDSSHPTITNNTISGNTTWGSGGGICCYNSSPMITNNTITGNGAGSMISGNGGGIGCGNESSPMITNNTISKNTAPVGGGIGCRGSSPMITNNTITGNDGGGILCEYDPSPTITNNTIVGNRAYQCGGISCYNASPIIINTILWENITSTGSEIYVFSGNPVVTFCDLKGGYSGTGNIDSDPLFVKLGYWDDNGTPSDPNDDFWVDGDYHLTFNSPCRASGDNTAVLDLYDFEGDPRIAYGTVDMGADEFYTHLYWTGDATPGGNVEIKFVGLPGTSPVGLCIGTGVLDPPIPSMWGDWYLQFPILGPVIMPSIPSSGVSILPGTIPSTYPSPASVPMQALIGAELTNLCVLEVK